MAEKEPENPSKRSRSDSIRTRSANTNWFIGTLTPELKKNQLPDVIDVLRYYQHRKETEFGTSIGKIDRANLCTEISLEIIKLWKSHSIFTVRKVDDVKKKLVREVDKLQKVLDNDARHVGDEGWIVYKRIILNFQLLFDIALCKCWKNLKSHMKVNTGITSKQKCHKCDKQYNSEANLRFHFQNSHYNNK